MNYRFGHQNDTLISKCLTKKKCHTHTVTSIDFNPKCWNAAFYQLWTVWKFIDALRRINHLLVKTLTHTTNRPTNLSCECVFVSSEFVNFVMYAVTNLKLLLLFGIHVLFMIIFRSFGCFRVTDDSILNKVKKPWENIKIHWHGKVSNWGKIRREEISAEMYYTIVSDRTGTVGANSIEKELNEWDQHDSVSNENWNYF